MILNVVVPNLSSLMATWAADSPEAIERLLTYAEQSCRIASTPLYVWREPLEAYCVKCRSKRQMSNPQAITMKNGRPATHGVCPICSTKMFRIGKAA